MELAFTSYCGHQPWFFVPDTGTPGGTATLTEPDGTVTPCHRTQLDPTVHEWPAIGIQAPRMGFETPVMFDDPGVYTLTVTQDTLAGGEVVDTYSINVKLDLLVIVDEGGNGEFGRLNQLRRAAGRPAFDLTEAASGTKGLSDVEVAAVNRFRQSRGWPKLKEG